MIRAFVLRVVGFFWALSVCYLIALLAFANAPLGFQLELQKHSNLPLHVPFRGESTLLRFRELPDYQDVDILFVGSSHAYRSFDPRIFARRGLKTFNLGSTSQTPLNSYYILEKHLQRLRPRLVVFEVFPVTLGLDGLESFLDLSENLPFSWDILRMALATRNFRALNALLLHFFDFDRAPPDSLTPQLAEQDTYVRGGYVETGEGHRGLSAPPPNRIHLETRQVHFMRKVFRLAKEAGAEVLLVSQPLPRETLASILNAEELTELIHAEAERAGIRYLDFNDMMNLDEAVDFSDYQHLSQRGVEKFNAMLIRELVSLGLI